MQGAGRGVPEGRRRIVLIESEIPRLQRALGRRIVMDLVAFPIIVVDDTVLQGEKEIRERFEAVMREKAGTPGK